MSFTFPILINTSNYVKGSINRYRYDLPAGSAIQLKAGSEITVQSCSIYNSVNNIRADWGNNVMVLFYDNFNLPVLNSYGFSTGTTYTDPYSGYTINKKHVKLTIPDGFYSIPDLSIYIKHQCLLMNFYLSSTTNNNDMFFIDFQINKNLYSGQINMYPIPSTLSGYSNPGSSFTLPSTPQTPFLYFPNTYSHSQYGSIGSLFGMNGGSFFPYAPTVSASGSSTPTQHLSVKTPTISPITNYLFSSNLSNNQYSNPQNLLFQMPINVGFGEMMVYRDQPLWMSCNEINISYIEITLFDQYCNKLMLNDPEFCLTLLIKIPRDIPKNIKNF